MDSNIKVLSSLISYS